MTRRRLPALAFLGINVIVSVVTSVLVLLVWDSRREPETVVPPTFSGVSSQSGGAASGLPEGSVEGAPQGQATPQNPAETGNGEQVVPPATQEAPGDGNIIHVVQPGEVLFDIGVLYDVPVEDIVIANGLESADVLDVGQQLIIPIGGLPPTPTPSVPPPTPTLALSPIATVTPAPSGAINIVVEDVVFPGDVTREAIVIVNNGSPVDMEGWVLVDEDGNEYAFPSFRLFGNGSSATIHTGVGEDEAGDLYWGRSIAVWGGGSDTVILLSPSGEVQGEFAVEP